MHILVISGFDESKASGRTKAARFVQSIKGLLQTVRPPQQDPPKLEVINRDRVGEYTYVTCSDFADPASHKRFDKLDMVFLDGDASMLPWSREARALCVFVKLCIVHGKPLLAAGPGILMVSFACATGGRQLKVQGTGRREDARRLRPERRHDQDVCFVESATGDFYAFSDSKRLWIPQGNTGLYHHKDAVAVKQSPRESTGVHPTPRRRVFQDRAQVSGTFSSKPLRGDTRVHIRATQIHNPLFNQVHGQAFLASDDLEWVVEEKTQIEAKNKFEVFADSERGPAVLQISRTVGISFHVDQEHAFSLLVAKNFARIWSKVSVQCTSARNEATFLAFDGGVRVVGNAVRLVSEAESAGTARARTRRIDSGHLTARASTPIHTARGSDKSMRPSTAFGPGGIGLRGAMDGYAIGAVDGVAAQTKWATARRTGEVPATPSARLQGLANRLGVALPHQRPQTAPVRSPDQRTRPGDVVKFTEDHPTAASVSEHSRPQSVPRLNLAANNKPGFHAVDGSLSSRDDGEGVGYSESGRPQRPPSRQAVRVHVKRTPHCTHRKYQTMAQKERPSSRRYTNKDLEGYFSVRNGGAYLTPYEQRVKAYESSKQQWVGSKNGFQTCFGVASAMQLPDDYGISASGPYEDGGPSNATLKKDRKRNWVAGSWMAIGDRQPPGQSRQGK